GPAFMPTADGDHSIETPVRHAPLKIGTTTASQEGQTTSPRPNSAKPSPEDVRKTPPPSLSAAPLKVLGNKDLMPQPWRGEHYGDYPRGSGLTDGMTREQVQGALGIANLYDYCTDDTDNDYASDRRGLNCRVSEREYGTLVFYDDVRGSSNGGLGIGTVTTEVLQAWFCCNEGQP
ncbi:hypothetical protein ACFXO2_41065, partial [Streptomyces sp. NPDC059152]|uniref:hypothetical protein n=1 Tax=Streptomyces sp. NPDC059152 TaxID=3346742 RepID=UPI0036A2C23E